MSRTTKIQLEFEYASNNETDKTERREYGKRNSVFKIKKDVYKTVKRLSGDTGFLIDEKPVIFGAQIGIHFGCYMSCMSNFPFL